MARTKQEKSEIDTFVKEIEKDFGPGSVIKLDSKQKVDVDVIPTGLYSLDIATGVGGFPRGRIIEIFGLESSGKSTLALNVVREAQKMGGRAAYIDMEQAIDTRYMKEKIGVDIDKLLFSQPMGGEEALKLVERYVSSDLVDVVVVDSVAALIPTAEVEGEMGSTTIGLQARLMSHAMRKLSPLVKKHNTLVIFINQIRMKIGGMGYGNPETTAGGMALKFYSSMRVEMRRVAWIKDNSGVQTGSKLRAKIVKNKVAPPFKSSEFVLSFEKGLWREYDLFSTGLQNNILHKEGNTYFFKDEKIGVGVNGSCEALEENKELVEKIIKALNDPEIKKSDIKEVKEEEDA